MEALVGSIFRIKTRDGKRGGKNLVSSCHFKHLPINSVTDNCFWEKSAINKFSKVSLWQHVSEPKSSIFQTKGQPSLCIGSFTPKVGEAVQNIFEFSKKIPFRFTFLRSVSLSRCLPPSLFVIYKHHSLFSPPLLSFFFSDFIFTVSWHIDSGPVEISCGNSG